MPSALLAIIISLAIGGVAYYLTHKIDGPITVSLRELIIGSAISIVVLLIVGPVTEKLILDGKTTYHEYFNGYETEAVEQIIPCDRDGSCNYTYDCDVYYVPVTHTYSDGDGHSHTYVTMEARYHDCPYVRSEAKYIVDSTLDNYQIGGNFSKDRTAWRAGIGVPADVPAGPPLQWVQARDRIAAHRNGGVTRKHNYKNLLLASDKTLLDQYSADIDYYSKAGLLPDHTRNYKDPIYNYYMADKFAAVGLNTDLAAWNESLLRLNGFLGAQLQGDVHMVAINASKAKDKDRYAQALFAYWKGHHFKKDAFPKNAIGVVVGVTDNKVVWARATGGLPVGNEALLLDIQNNLVGVPFEPDALIGLPLQKTGALYSQLWGVHKFDRPCMECIQEHRDGYVYLKSDVYVSGWQRFWIVFVATLCSAGMWFAFLNVDDRVKKYYGGYYGD